MLYIHPMNINNIDLNLLLVFDALFKQRSVTKAASQLNLSQPALSHALNRLRHTFNDELFLRSPKGMSPTDKAFSMKVGIDKILNTIKEELLDEKIFDPKTSTKLFHICSTDNEQLTHLKILFKRLKIIAPGIRVKYSYPNVATFFEDMESAKVDLSFGVNTPKLSHFSYENIYSEGLVCLIKNNNQTPIKRLTLKKYLEMDHILVAPLGGNTGPVDDYLDKIKLTRKVSAIVQNFALVPFYLLERDLIFTSPKALAKEFIKQFDLKLYKVPLDLPEFNVEMIWHKRTQNNDAHVWLRQMIKESLSLSC